MSKAGLKKITVSLPLDWDDPEDLPHIIEPLPNEDILNYPKIIGQALRKFQKYNLALNQDSLGLVDHPGTERLLNRILRKGNHENNPCKN